MRRTLWPAALIAVLALTSAPAQAHVKWFEDASRHPIRAELVLSWRTALFLGVAAAALVLLYAAQRVAGTPHWPRVWFLRKMAIGAPTLLAVQAAIGLIHAGTALDLFAPNLPLEPNALGYALAALQIGIAFSFITGVADWFSALVLIVLGPLAFALYPPMDVLEQLYWAGIGVVVLVIGRFSVDGGEARSWFAARSPASAARAIAAMRVIAGVAIVMPALGEKLWNPDLGAAFLANRPHFNVLRPFGVDDGTFVLLAGIAEGTIGVLLASGLLTRVVILFMWLPFNAGVPFLPPQELIGHLPIFGIMYFLLVHSAGIAPGESPDRPVPPGSARSPADDT